MSTLTYQLGQTVYILQHRPKQNDLWNDGTTSNPPTFHNTGYPPGGNEETEERST